MFRRRVAAAVIAALIAASGSFAMATPANAAPKHCGAGAGCAFQNTGFNGGWLGFQNSISDYGNHLWRGKKVTADNSTSSFYNNGRIQRIAWYKDRTKGRPPYYLGLGKFDSNLHDAVGTPAGWQDVIGSSYFTK